MINSEHTENTNAKESFLVLSAHDFRSPRKASMHFITEELARRGPTRFFSVRYSHLSRYTNDPRMSLDKHANCVVHHNGVDCYLWKTWIHPFNTRRRWLQPAESVMFYWYGLGRNPVLRDWIRSSTTIVMESGVAPIFFDTIKRLNPNARLIYRASDALDTINVAKYVEDTFTRVASDFDTIILPSKIMADSIQSHKNLAFVPHGIDPSILKNADPSPYDDGIHAVTVGSMLFDTGFFEVASQQFPHVHFHIIGSGHPRAPGYGNNVTVYGEMPHRETLRYIKHAAFGIAPYKTEDVPGYLKDTSMKLIQFDFLGCPAVCPHRVAGEYKSRFGYRPGDPESIFAAIQAALQSPKHTPQNQLQWRDVADRILAPHHFHDTEISL